MNNSNFNASEISQIITKIETTKDEMRTLLNNISNDFSELSGIVVSEDSSLAATCNNINATYKNLLTKLINNLEVVKNTLNKYVQETLQNEATSAQNLSKTNESLSDAKSVLDSI